jgi:hypothetical protein
MEKNNIHEIINDLKAKRDALSLAHEQLKKDNDDWNKCIIVLSLTTGMIESAKLQMRWDNSIASLTPILLTSIIASVSALIKFKKFPEQMETLIKSTSLITNTLSKCRNYDGNPDNIDHLTLIEYNDALEKLETSVYPDIRKKYLKISHMNLAKIMKYEKYYFNQIEKSNNSNVSVSDLSSDKGNTFPFKRSNSETEDFVEEMKINKEKQMKQKVRLSLGTRRNDLVTKLPQEFPEKITSDGHITNEVKIEDLESVL